MRGGEGFFTRTEVRQAVAALRQAAGRDDLPPEGADNGEALVSLVRAVLAPLGLTNEEPSGTQARERWASLSALVALTEEQLVHEPELTLTGFYRSSRPEPRRGTHRPCKV